MEKKGVMARLGAIYNRLEEYLLTASLAANVLIVFLQVIMRTVFKNSLTWSEELSRYIFIWQIWLGTSLAFKYQEHIRVTLLTSFLSSDRAKAAVALLADGIWFLFCIFMICNGWELLLSMAGRNTASSGLGLPLVYIYAAIPVSALLVALRLTGTLKADVEKLTGREKEKGGESL